MLIIKYLDVRILEFGHQLTSSIFFYRQLDVTLIHQLKDKVDL